MDDDSLLFTLVPIFIAVIGVIVVGTIVVGLLLALRRWTRNNNSPVVTDPAVVVGKRNRTSGSSDGPAHTSYFVTFELQGGERVEMQLNGPDSGLLVEGDRGRLTRQGTRYKGFDRTPADR